MSDCFYERRDTNTNNNNNNTRNFFGENTNVNPNNCNNINNQFDFPVPEILYSDDLNA